MTKPSRKEILEKARAAKNPEKARAAMDIAREHKLVPEGITNHVGSLWLDDRTLQIYKDQKPPQRGQAYRDGLAAKEAVVALQKTLVRLKCAPKSIIVGSGTVTVVFPKFTIEAESEVQVYLQALMHLFPTPTDDEQDSQ